MKILGFSDLHLDVEAAEKILAVSDEADLIVGVGDFAQRREGLSEYMPMFAPIADKAIFIPGNNETVEELRAATQVKVHDCEKVQRDGLGIVTIGSAIPPLPSIATASVNVTEVAAREILAQFEECDLLLSHSPPFGVADLLDQDLADFLGLDVTTRMGSTAVRDFIERVQPKLCLCGHIHSSWGQEGMIGNTRVVNLGPSPNWFEL